MVEIFRPSQKRSLCGVVAVLVFEVIFRSPTAKNSVAVIERQLLDENNACT